MIIAREDGKSNIIITGLSEKKVNNVESIMNVIEFGS